MGKQVEFYMTHADELAFVETVQQKFGPLVVVLNTSKSGVETVSGLKPVDAYNSNLSIVREGDLPRLITGYVPTQEIYCIDLLESPVIQFNRCRMISGWLATGRLWFDESTDTGRKNEDFCIWANKLLVWFRRQYRRTNERNCFVGSEAAELSASGLLKLGPPIEGYSVIVL